MPVYKLSYFNIRARAETARMLFKLGGQDFEDNRIERSDWPQIKPTMPMAQIPVLEVDGTVICQSNAINRYLARQFDYYGSTALEQALVDMVVDSLEDATKNVVPIIRATNEEVKATLAKAYREDILIPALINIQKMLERNNSGNGYFVGESLTLADIAYLNIVTMCVTVSQDANLLNDYPKLTELKSRVENEPTIAAWIKVRPVTPL